MYWNKEKYGISLKCQTIIITLTLTCAALAADWPQYLGAGQELNLAGKRDSADLA